jgi:hypothetical protein
MLKESRNTTRTILEHALSYTVAVPAEGAPAHDRDGQITLISG